MSRTRNEARCCHVQRQEESAKNDWRQSIMSLGQVKNEANESESQTTRRMPFGRTGRTDRPQSQHMPTATMPNGPATGMQVAAQAAPPQKRKRFKMLIYAFAFLMVFALGVGAGSSNASKPAGRSRLLQSRPPSRSTPRRTTPN